MGELQSKSRELDFTMKQLVDASERQSKREQKVNELQVENSKMRAQLERAKTVLELSERPMQMQSGNQSPGSVMSKSPRSFLRSRDMTPSKTSPSPKLSEIPKKTTSPKLPNQQPGLPFPALNPFAIVNSGNNMPPMTMPFIAPGMLMSPMQGVSPNPTVPLAGSPLQFYQNPMLPPYLGMRTK
eukprot:TRINITY_DN7395_c0_g1_i11.p1 TRINITY_DN7395_c0_g1~~TRINITY_DN7395_c0_g1_i11.p1  ORF type:complete len:184 (-),score=41.26 TRINITY_DN7395_c0_g1_i11:125-676(-)